MFTGDIIAGDKSVEPLSAFLQLEIISGIFS